MNAQSMTVAEALKLYNEYLQIKNYRMANEWYRRFNRMTRAKAGNHYVDYGTE